MRRPGTATGNASDARYPTTLRWASYACILDQAGETRVHRKMRCDPARVLELLKPFRKNVVVAGERLFCRCWLADLCAEADIPVVLGHALYA